LPGRQGGATIAVEDRRRIALHRAAAESWGEEAADTLMDSIAPSGHELATRQDIDGILAAMTAMDERWEENLTAMDHRWDGRITAMDQRWDERLGAMHQRLEDLDGRWQAEANSLRHELIAAFERGINQAVTKQTRTLVLSQLAVILMVAGLVITS
jgi:phage-related minor tail protein